MINKFKVHENEIKLTND